MIKKQPKLEKCPFETENKSDLHTSDTRQNIGTVWPHLPQNLKSALDKSKENEFAAHLCLKRFTLFNDADERYFQNKRFTLFNDADERYFQKRGHELHLYELLVTLRERKHSRNSLNNDILTHAPEH